MDDPVTDEATAPILTFAGSLYAALDGDDIEPFVDLCATDVVVEYPASGVLPYGGTWRGHDGVRRFLEAHDLAEEIIAFEPGAMTAGGDRVFVLGSFEGRARPTGATWSTTFAHVLTISSGRLLRWEAYFDTAAAVRAHRTS